MQPSISDGAILLTMRTSVSIELFEEQFGRRLASVVKLPPLRINTSGWDAKFSDHRMHVQTGPTPFGSDAPFGRLAFSTDAAMHLDGADASTGQDRLRRRISSLRMMHLSTYDAPTK